MDVSWSGPLLWAKNGTLSDTPDFATGGGKTLKTAKFGSLFKQENGLLGLSERAHSNKEKKE
jgi:hypothetical protein